MAVVPFFGAAVAVGLAQLRDRRMDAADRAVRILRQLQVSEAHRERVVDEEPADERRADPEDQLERFGRLDGADDARQHAEDAGLGATGHEAGRRGLGMQAAIAGAARRREHGRLPFEAEDAAPRVRLAEHHARVVHEVARGKIVGAVHDDVERVDERPGVRDREARVERLDVNLGIQRLDPVARGRDLRSADVVRAVDDLPLQVADIHGVEVDDPDGADARRGQIQGRRRSQSARADAQDTRRLETPLPFFPHLRQEEMPAVALALRE